MMFDDEPEWLSDMGAEASVESEQPREDMEQGMSDPAERKDMKTALIGDNDNADYGKDKKQSIDISGEKLTHGLIMGIAMVILYNYIVYRDIAPGVY